MNIDMKRISFISALLAFNTALNAEYPHHVIHAVIHHSTNEISVTDTIVFPEGMPDNSGVLEFTLNSELEMEPSGTDFIIEKMKDTEGDGFDRYRLFFSSNQGGRIMIPVRYRGRIEHQIETGAAEYARGFSSTDGIISPDGIYLAGSSGWIPGFERSKLFTFRLTAELDAEWSLVTQGTRIFNTISGHRRKVQYDSPDPVDEVYFVAGKWTEYSGYSGNILIQAFLRTPDEDLANRYIGVTSHYLAIFEEMIGEYPYTKFALVENFWETGYGMPSFTLLGEKVIRFPWILHSSYPHELLHNYWGNSVYVDYSQGNWCEGITAYMADHLIKEQQGLADDYRRTTLQKFTDYVNPGNDFPPSEFISRNNPAEEAIGYGKVLMFNNMLRDEFGDEAFRAAYADFYEKNRFRYASWDDIRISFEYITGKGLKPMFDEWILRKGAPSLQLSDVLVTAAEGSYKLEYTIKQIQEEEFFALNIPVAIYLENIPDVYTTRVRMDTRRMTFSHHLNNRPLKISVDPQFNLMRRLHYSEVPSSLSQLFGAERSAIILPGESLQTEAYLKLAEFWKKTLEVQGKELEILYDTDIEEIPSGMPVWIAGFRNSFYKEINISHLYQNVLSDQEQSTILELARDQSLVFAIPNQNFPAQTIGFIGTHHPEALVSLGRKLMHYGNYGYLGFTGNEYTNVLKGSFPVMNSVLDHVIHYKDHPAIHQKLENRKALSDLP
jgi:hypothetical protein